MTNPYKLFYDKVHVFVHTNDGKEILMELPFSTIINTKTNKIVKQQPTPESWKTLNKYNGWERVSDRLPL
jgi:hypothetical protein